MNDELNQRLVESFDSVKDWVESGTEFVQEQAPLVVNELITWGIVECLIVACGFLMTFIVVQIAVQHARKLAKKYLRAGTEDIIAINVISYVFQYLSFGLFVGVIYNLQYALYIYMCPRLYVLDKLSELIKDVI